MSFILRELRLIHKGALVAQAKIEMTSGMILTCNILRSRKDAEQIFAMPIGEKTATGYVQTVEFATAELKAAWQTAALEALKPRWAELVAPPTHRPAENGGGNYAPF